MDGPLILRRLALFRNATYRLKQNPKSRPVRWLTVYQRYRRSCDDAGQFNLLIHANCWAHAERIIHRLI